jgi:hypothetical protein
MANSIAVNLFYHRGHREAQRESWARTQRALFGQEGPILHGRDARAYIYYFFLSTRKRANDFSVSARAPKLSSEVKALSTSASAFFRDSSIPNSAG